MGSQHPSPNVKTFCKFEAQIWLEIITSRDAKSACFKGSRTSCREIIFGIFWPNFGQKRSHHVMDASCRQNEFRDNFCDAIFTLRHPKLLDGFFFCLQLEASYLQLSFSSYSCVCGHSSGAPNLQNLSEKYWQYTSNLPLHTK